MAKKTIEEITGETEASKIIQKLKENSQTIDPKIVESSKLIDVENHDIFNPNKRKDRVVENYDENDKLVSSKIITVNRIGIPFQKRIVNTAVAFAFGNPVKWTLEGNEEAQRKYFDSYFSVLKNSKYDSLDKLMCSSLKTFTESAELWYAVEGEEHEKYGFKTKLKIKCLVLDSNNSKLYPYFDEFGDLMAFTREYIIKENKLDVTYYDVYTASQIIRFKNSNDGYVVVSNVENKLGKIQIVYIQQKQTEYQEVQTAIDRLSLIMSNHAETNDYHSSPTLFGKGQFSSIAEKGEQGKVYIGQVGSELEYVTWDSAPESMKLEIENLYRIIFEFTQTPNFSFEQVKGLGSVSGVALKLMFLDAHLKVVHDKVIYDAWMDRRKSIILSFLGLMDNANKENYDKLEISHEIRPYMIDDRKALIEELTLANGNKPIISQVRSIQMFGEASDSQSEYEQILQEEKESSTVDLFQTAQ